jgi:hypothetical protein
MLLWEILVTGKMFLFKTYYIPILRLVSKLPGMRFVRIIERKNQEMVDKKQAKQRNRICR